MLLLGIVLALLGYISPACAFWRMECRALLGQARIDPLVTFGGPSTHAHVLFGAQNLNFESTPETITSSSCTSCKVVEDKSNYWSPMMYFEGEDGSLEAVNVDGGMLAYYFLNGNNIKAFPIGFQMISGDSDRRNFSLPTPDPDPVAWTETEKTQDALAQKAIGFNCMNYKGGYNEPSLGRHTMPTKDFLDQNCPDGLRAELMFPSCSNGQADSPNHKDHVAFPDQVMTGNCPPGFDTRLPSLFYETIYRVQDFKGRAGKFVFSNGDESGCGYHADFMQGWEPSFLQQAIDTCTYDSGMVEDCKIFTLQTTDQAAQCTLDLPDVIRTENVKGPLRVLPGNANVGGTPSSPESGEEQPPVPAPIQPAVSAVAGIFAKVSSTDAPPTDPTPTPAPTPEPTPAPEGPPALEADQKILYTSTYTSEKQEVHLVMIEEEVIVSVPATATVVVNPEKRHAHQHRHLRRRRGF